MLCLSEAAMMSPELTDSMLIKRQGNARAVNPCRGRHGETAPPRWGQCCTPQSQVHQRCAESPSRGGQHGALLENRNMTGLLLSSALPISGWVCMVLSCHAHPHARPLRGQRPALTLTPWSNVPSREWEVVCNSVRAREWCVCVCVCVCVCERERVRVFAVWV